MATAPIPPLSTSELVRFWAKVEQSAPDTCWHWTATIGRGGYGRFYRERSHHAVRAHRVAFVVAEGRDPGDLHVLHKCDNRLCVNPAHLWLGTNDDNVADMLAKGRHASQRRTQCIHGHAFTPENTFVGKDGHRQCRTCKRTRDRLRHAKRVLRGRTAEACPPALPPRG